MTEAACESIHSTAVCQDRVPGNLRGNQRTSCWVNQHTSDHSRFEIAASRFAAMFARQSNLCG
jgi:hypothetical protein